MGKPRVAVDLCHEYLWATYIYNGSASLPMLLQLNRFHIGIWTLNDWSIGRCIDWSLNLRSLIGLGVGRQDAVL